MARILITGSADGLGSLAARQLVRRGHAVILHARNAERAEAARQACPGAETVLIGDLSSISSTKNLAAEINAYASGSTTSAPAAAAAAVAVAEPRPIDCVIHNAGLYKEPKRNPNDNSRTTPAITTVNTLAPYILTCLMHRPEGSQGSQGSQRSQQVQGPQRLVYVTSGYHHNGDASLRDITREERGKRSYNDLQMYADSKLHDVLMAKAFARRLNSGGGGDSRSGKGDSSNNMIRSNALDPGWVPTKMGGASAPGSLDAAVETYVMLAEGAGDTEASIKAKKNSSGGGGGDGKSHDATGKLFGPRRRESRPKAEADDINTQDRLLEILEKITGVKVPE